MKLNKLPFFFLVLILVVSCSSGGGGGSAPAKTLQSIEITPSDLSLAAGTTGQFTATGTYSDNSTQNITTSVTWSSSNTAAASIGASTGLATALAAGSTTITASSGSLSATAALTVIAITSIDVTPVNPVIPLGATQQFIATGTLSNGSSQVLTNSVTWTSSSPATASVGNTSGSYGLASSLAEGTTTIKASLSGVFGSSLLTITPMDNVMKVTVNGSLCSPGSYPNKPCVSVTVCSPGSTSNCNIIDDILLDTGSTGLRIFKSLLTGLTLSSVTTDTGLLADCIQYMDGSANWGPVQIADVVLGNLKASNIPIQVIDADFGKVPAACGMPDTSPTASGYNGIMGAGLFTEDCGSTCASVTNNGMYYSCSGETCNATTAPLSDQVKNPVSLLSSDNNGFIIRLPDVPLGGALSADGIMILGIGTRTNNSTSGITSSFSTNSKGEFSTVFRSITYSDSFMDSGSNGLFFNRSFLTSLIICGDWYCPASTLTLSAAIEGNTVAFKIGNSTTLFGSPNNVFSELGGTLTSFDWGLPFFLGRSVYIGIEGQTSGLGTGPYLAY